MKDRRRKVWLALLSVFLLAVSAFPVRSGAVAAYVPQLNPETGFSLEPLGEKEWLVYGPSIMADGWQCRIEDILGELHRDDIVMSVCDAAGNSLDPVLMARTGTVITVRDPENGAALAQITAIVRGDAACTGSMGLLQLVRTAAEIRSPGSLPATSQRAADLNANGRVDLTDLLRISRAVRFAAVSEEPGSAVGSASPEQKEVLRRVNAVRAENGTPLLALCGPLNAAANVLAAEMAQQDAASAVRPDGSGWRTVLTTPAKALNMVCAQLAPVLMSGVAQVAADQLLAVNVSALASPAFSHAGIGISRGSDGCWYACMLVSDSAKVTAVSDVVSAPLPSPTPSTNPPGSASAIAKRILAAGEALIGKPYLYGAAGPDAFDCSGFVYCVLRETGVDVDRTASYVYATMSRWEYVAKASDLLPGDLVFFKSGASQQISHVGFYAGSGMILHCAPSVNGVGYSTMLSGYYEEHFVCARRIAS